jgi:ankyrin repeat protein
VDLDVKDHAGDTPLHLAVRLGDIYAVQLLLKLGADPTITNNKGNIPMDVCEEIIQTEELKAQ